MGHRVWLAAAVLAAAVHGASAQNLNQVIVFGASGTDAGWFNGTTFPSGSPNPTYDVLLEQAVAEGGGAQTTNPGLMSIEVLAQHLGLTAYPANQTGGTNYSIAGTRVTGPGPTANAIPIAVQMENHLAASDGRANPNALYFVGLGLNDVSFAINNLPLADRPAYISTTAAELVAAVAGLKAAGARYFMVGNALNSFGTADEQVLRTQLANEVWWGLAAAGINFIPFDNNSLLVEILQNPGRFGILNTTDPACERPVGLPMGSYAALCGTSVAPLVEPGADQTRLFADDMEHLATAGQEIFGDSMYNLLVAPSQISFLAEAPVKTRAALMSAIRNQIELSKRQNGPAGFNVWISGDVSRLGMKNYRGFPDDPGTPLAITVGVDAKSASGSIFGIAVSAGTTKQSYSTGGGFRQTEFSASLYHAGSSGPFWYDLIGSVGYLDYDIDRSMPIGITTQPNRGSTDGWNVSGSARAGVDFVQEAFTHGPFAGLLAQRVRVKGFTESGSFTSLSFGAQARNSLVGTVGYQWAATGGSLRPFLQVSWNHELASTNRLITASLTTVAAPSYSLPAVQPGKSWGAATLGARFDLAANMKGYAAVTGQFGQGDVTAYGGQIGVSAPF